MNQVCNRKLAAEPLGPLVPCLLALLVAARPAAGGETSFELGRLESGARAAVVQNADGRWGLRVGGAGRASVLQPEPILIEFHAETAADIAADSRRTPQLWRWTTSAPAAGWEEPEFEDSAWSEGPGGFGTEGTPGSVVRTPWNTADIWLRRQFTLERLPAGGLSLWIHHDEDAEVYLNGVQFGRRQGYVADYEKVPLSAEASGALRVGRNIIAVHCHQTGGGQYIDAGLIETRATASAVSAGYDAIETTSAGCIARGIVSGGNAARFEVADHWRVTSGILHLERSVRVRGAGSGGFLSGITLPIQASLAWTNVKWFAPGMIYGGFENLTTTAIGGAAHYTTGRYTVRIREDRLPAPLFAAHFPDGSSLAVLDPAPRGDTTTADSLDVTGQSMVDAGFRFAALGAEEHERTLQIGMWFPGSEGEATYAGNTYPGGQLHHWRRRHHPLRDGFTQHYQAAFRFGKEASFRDAYKQHWRWAWNTLRPAIAVHDLASARSNIVNVLSACVVEKDGRAGIPNFVDAVSKRINPNDKAVMGFCGKNLEAAEFMLREACLDPGERGKRLRAQAEAIIASFLRLNLAPPAGEGFSLADGAPRCAIGANEVFLRSFGDDIKALLRACRHEERQGRPHPEWVAWCRQFGDWLLTQQQPAGGFPRTWRPGTGQVISASPNSSYNAIPMLVLLTEATGQKRYLQAAVRAADFCWQNGQDEGRFVGGTIDNPDVVDKEAGTLSLEAYLALAQTTRQNRWRPRARTAADFAETWIYLWDIPIPPDNQDPNLHWKHGVPTAGLQLISSGHSLVDAYMAFDPDEYALLFELTGDRHYLEVARLLLHNTKSMVAMPGRTYDLQIPGWQQEHWSLAPRRGYGLHRGWLPWVATSQLNGIFGVMDLDENTRSQLGVPGAQ